MTDQKKELISLRICVIALLFLMGFCAYLAGERLGELKDLKSTAVSRGHAV